MSSPYATVLTPIIDRAETLSEAIPTGLGQTEADIEILIVGSGATPEVLAVAHGFAGQDSRVRVLDLPPSPVLTGTARHTALGEARSDRIFILQDDDLWLPDHVRSLGGLLDDNELATDMSVAATLSGGLVGWPCSLHAPGYVDLYRRGASKVVYEAHYAFRRSAYDRLEVRWDRMGDGGCSRKLLDIMTADGGARIGAGARPTALSLNSPPRSGMSVPERATEMRAWKDRLAGRTTLDALLPSVRFTPVLNTLFVVGPPTVGTSLADYLAPLGVRLPDSADRGGTIPLPADAAQIRDMEALLALWTGGPTAGADLPRLAVDLLEPFSAREPRLRLIRSVFVRALGLAAVADLCRTAVAAEPHPHRAALAGLGLAFCLNAMSEPDAAAEAWNAAEATSASTALSSPVLATRMLLHGGRVPEAIALVESCLRDGRVAPDRVETMIQVLARKGQAGPAEGILRRAREIFPDLPPSLDRQRSGR